MKFKNLTISKQLNIGLGIIFLFVVLLGVISLYSADRLWQNTKGLYEHPLLSQRAIGAIQTDILSIRLEMKELILEKNEQKIQERFTFIAKYETDANQQIDILYTTYLGPMSDIDTARNSIVQYRLVRDETIRLFQAGNLDEAAQRVMIDGAGGIQVKKLMGDLAIVYDFSKNKATQLYSDAEKQKNQSAMQLTFTLIVILLLSGGISVFLRKGILTPLKELTAATGAFQQGKLETRSRYQSANEFGTLSNAFNTMTATIQIEFQNKEKRNAELIDLKNNLEAVNKELEAFSYSVSHDLKAPLRHITGYISLLVKKYTEKIPEEGLNYLNNISYSAKNMGELIDGLLQFSKTGRIDMIQKPINMNEIVDALIQPIIEQDLEHRIKFEIETMPVVFGDSAMIQSVWSNLIENAVKFTKNKTVAKISIGAKGNERDYTFHIKDNGAGFDMNYAAKMFSVFQRLHSREDYEGTGIGLATIQRIITRHGGKTWAEGHVGEGATFYFSLIKRKENE